MQVLLRKVRYTCEYEEAKARTISAPWYSKYQGSLPWYFPVVLSPVTNVLIPSKKMFCWSMVLTCGTEKG